MKAAWQSGDRRAAGSCAKSWLARRRTVSRPTRPPGSGSAPPCATALTAARAQQLITVNVAALAELESGKRPKALVWTPERVARWHQTGEVPSPVMVWTAEQTGAFLQRAAGHECFALFHLIAFTGLRRGEAVGLRWVDVDLDANTLHVAQQIVQIDWETFITPPKSEAGERDVAVDDRSVAIPRRTERSKPRRVWPRARTGLIRGWCSPGPDGD